MRILALNSLGPRMCPMSTVPATANAVTAFVIEGIVSRYGPVESVLGSDVKRTSSAAGFALADAARAAYSTPSVRRSWRLCPPCVICPPAADQPASAGMTSSCPVMGLSDPNPLIPKSPHLNRYAIPKKARPRTYTPPRYKHKQPNAPTASPKASSKPSMSPPAPSLPSQGASPIPAQSLSTTVPPSTKPMAPTPPAPR